jgi:cytochrome bd-type quinol oxidase subunit 2
MTTSAKGTARSVGSSKAVTTLARAGYAANGVLHILIGVIAVSVAFGGGGSADQGGALGALAANPAGAALLWVMVVGLAALALWGVVQAVLAKGSDAKETWKARAKEGGKAVAYAAVALTAAQAATGGGSDGDESAKSLSSTLLANPFGIALLLVVAAGIIAIGVYFVVKGAKKKFLEDIVRPSGRAGRVTDIIGRVGYISKGVALVVVGVLFGIAAVTADPNQAAGLDGALKALAALPFGAILLTLIGVGFVAYGLYCGVRARRAKL